MAGGVSNITIPTLSYHAGTVGKMSLPVEPSSLVYSHFEHVSGTVAPEGTRGISISKLNLLDVLIGRVNQIRKNGVSLPEAPLLPPEGIDAVMESYNSQIRTAESAGRTMPYIQTPPAGQPSLFSLVI